MKRLAILGAGGHGRVVADAAEASGWEVIEFFDDLWPEKNANGAWRVVGNKSTLFERLSDYDGVIVAIGNNKVRWNYVTELLQRNATLVNIIHPQATISRHARLGRGVVVFAGAVINPFSHIDDAVIVNTASSIDHDCTIGHAAHICPGVHLAGGVHIGELCWIGIGSVVKEYVSIGKHCMIGAGAAVIKSLEDHTIAYGIPATPRGSYNA